MKFKYSLLLGSLVWCSLAFAAGPVLADFNVDDRVECRWKNGSTWYQGVIAEKTGNQVFIHYNDGDKEHTTIDKCRKLGGTVLADFNVDDRVECRWKNGSTWYQGVIAEKTGNQVFIHYNDGDKEHTTIDKCRKLGGAAPTGNLKKGSKVSCYWKGGRTLYPGVIKEKTGNKVFIHYNDGDKEHTTIDKCQPR